MNKEAIELFKLLTSIEFQIGTISLNDFYLRLITLYDFSNKSEQIRDYIFDLFGENANFDNVEYSFIENTIDIENIDKEKAVTNDDKEKPMLQFITANKGEISKWKFILGDPDFYPSIPHGHAVKNRNIKLDSYQGYFYDTSKRNQKNVLIGREKRKFIIELWNDEKFRIFASKHINWYLNKFPYFEWRVPRRRIKILPKKRKQKTI